MSNTSTETVTDRIARLGLTVSEKRAETLAKAHSLVDDNVFKKIAEALRVKSNSESIVLPAHRFENLSRGRGWARQGKGENVTWADRVDNGYECSPGKWSIGATDGFSRKDSTDWTVMHITVGEQTWTLAI